jgi:hypothetical protein
MTKSGHNPVQADFEMDNAKMGSTFLCFISTYLVQYLKEDGKIVSQHEILIDACRACFPMYEAGKVIDICQSGIEQHRVMLNSGWIYDIDGYVEEIADLVRAYIMFDDEERSARFAELYEALYEIRDIIEEEQ